ncbi:hypothetical protein [Paraburkholderia sediminicola]|uniref:hypothetical protein n=1 Tax=Paraburkholderia sediminicola TaxID=458836 RepID=UPI0038B7A726
MDTLTVPKSLLEKFSWDESKREYFMLVPRTQTLRLCGGVSQPNLARYRVEIRPQSYTVLIPQ